MTYDALWRQNALHVGVMRFACDVDGTPAIVVRMVRVSAAAKQQSHRASLTRARGTTKRRLAPVVGKVWGSAAIEQKLD